MADEVVHVLLTDYGQYGWGVSSPQLPELIGGRDSYEDLRRDLAEILEFGGLDASASVVIHRQKYVVAPGGDETFVIRIANDEREFDRFEAGMRLTGVLNDPRQRSQILAGPKTPSGEQIFICGTPTDTLGWLTEQLLPGEFASVISSVADEMFGGKPIRECIIGHAVEPADKGWMTLSEAGLTAETTLAELSVAQDSGRLSQLEALTVC
ncbi:hypothetical protein [Streptomyces sp. YPW6]|uniref:hypothetical protein n=1 Tax=Streptomyces sp. YPW6 TaxID=2840373 RepID=UPI003D71A64D